MTPATHECRDDDRRIIAFHEVIAFHEAAHAVVARALGRSVALVTIIPSKGRLGAMWPVAPDAAPKTVEEQIRDTVDLCARARALMPVGQPRAPGAVFLVEVADQAIVSLAGPMAEQRLTGVFDVAVARADLAEARAYAAASAILPESEGDYLRLFRAEARALVERNWPAITAVADALIYRQTLTGEDVESIIATATAARDVGGREAPLGGVGLT